MVNMYKNQTLSKATKLERYAQRILNHQKKSKEI